MSACISGLQAGHPRQGADQAGPAFFPDLQPPASGHQPSEVRP